VWEKAGGAREPKGGGGGGGGLTVLSDVMLCQK